MDKNIRILLVDDFSMSRTTERALLAELGYTQVEEAVNGALAHEKILKAYQDNVPFGLVLCDWNMPVMSGIELLELIRAHPDFKSLLFIMVTAESESSSIVTAIDKGATDYLIKPFTKEAFQEKLLKIEQRTKK